MFRKILTLSILFPSLAVAQPPIQDCRAFLLDMSALGFRAGVCRKNVEQLEVIRLRERQQECSAISADPTLQVEIRALHLTMHDEFINEVVTQDALEAALAGKQIDASQTEFCKAYDKQLEEMARHYLQP